MKNGIGNTMKILRVLLVTGLVVVAGRTFQADAQTETNLYSFAGSPIDGANPQAGLVQGSDGNFYGTTSSGGTNGAGTVFEFSPSADYTNLYAFGSYPNDGAEPVAGLVQGSDSNFYGTTYFGGTSDKGTVFQINPSGTYTTLYSFAGLPNDGADPAAGLVQGNDGNFYGTTYFGGMTSEFNGNGNGTVFQISPGGTYTTLYFFAGYPGDGADPQAGLVQGSDSNFYGTTQFGGMSTNCGAGCGTVFQISPSGTYTSLYSFAGPPNDGSYPLAGLVQGSDGNLYGTTGAGGTNSNGTVFRISPGGSYTNLYSFAGAPRDGAGPTAGLVQGSDSSFYGTALYGGNNGDGTVFRISSSGDYTNLYSFAGSPTDGQNPYAGLVQGSDGNFYGTTRYGGNNGDGTVFKLAFVSGITNCAFSIGSTNATVDAAGGSSNVSVTASNGCSWTATNNDSFLTITAGTNGVGSGTVSYSVAPNTTTNILTGTMTIAGQTFTVTELGTPTVGNCTFALNATSAKLGQGRLEERGRDNPGDRLRMDGCEQRSIYHYHLWQQRLGQGQGRLHRPWQHEHHGTDRHDDDCGPDIHRESGGRRLQVLAQSEEGETPGRRGFGDRDGEAQPQRLRVDRRQQRFVYQHHGRQERCRRGNGQLLRQPQHQFRHAHGLDDHRRGDIHGNPVGPEVTGLRDHGTDCARQRDLPGCR